MARKLPLERLGDEIGRILGEYSMEVTEDAQDAVREVTKAGRLAVSQNARAQFDGTGRYARGWASRVDVSRTGAVGVIYNATLPGLPHLLEFGHAKRGGGRVAGRSHIAPVEERIARDFERKVRVSIT